MLSWKLKHAINKCNNTCYNNNNNNNNNNIILLFFQTFAEWTSDCIHRFIHAAMKNDFVTGGTTLYS